MILLGQAPRALVGHSVRLWLLLACSVFDASSMGCLPPERTLEDRITTDADQREDGAEFDTDVLDSETREVDANDGCPDRVESGAESGACSPPIPNGECGTIPQCGCEAGESCDFVYVLIDPEGNHGWTTECVPTRNLQRGYPCWEEDCAPGLTCIDTCSPFCRDDQDCKAVAVGSACVGLDSKLPEFKVCTDQCDPISGSGCPPGVGCEIISGGKQVPGHSMCMTGASTTSCDEESCALGYSCMSDSLCYKYCRDVADCGAGKWVCAAADEGYYYVGDVAYGFCFPG